jgi:hypothetical protein
MPELKKSCHLYICRAISSRQVLNSMSHLFRNQHSPLPKAARAVCIHCPFIAVRQLTADFAVHRFKINPSPLQIIRPEWRTINTRPQGRDENSCHLERSRYTRFLIQNTDVILSGVKRVERSAVVLRQKSLRCSRVQAGRPRASDFARRGVPPPGQNKYFCGNLPIITRLCETPNRSPRLQAVERNRKGTAFSPYNTPFRNKKAQLSS